MALMETLRLNDTGTGIDPAVWNVSVNVFPNYLGAGVGVGADLVFNNLTSVNAYDLTASYAYIAVDSIRSPMPTTKFVLPIRLNKDANNYIYWEINDEKIKAYKVVAGATTLLTQATYTRSLHKVFRIRESGGTVYWDYSRDRVTWTNFTSATVASLFAVTSLAWQIAAYVTVVDTNDAIYFDCVNISYPLYNTLSDNFNDNSIDTSKWNKYEIDGITVTETNQRIELTYPASTPHDTQSFFTSWFFNVDIPARPHDFNGGKAWAEIIQVPNSATTAYGTFVVQQIYNLNYARWRIQSGSLYAEVQVATGAGLTTVATLTYNSTTHRWWRIREAASVFYFETSSDCITWNLAGSFAYDFSMAAVDYSYYVFTDASPATVTNAGKFILDNANVSVFTPIISGTFLLSGDAIRVYIAHRSAEGTFLLSGRVRLTQLSVPTSVERKTYLYKIYNEAGTFLGVWPDVVNELEFTEQINNPGSTIEVELARNSDTLISATTPLLDSSSVNITDNNLLTIDTELLSSNQIGPGSNVNHNYGVDIYVYYGSVEPLLDSDEAPITDSDGQEIQTSIGSPNGLRLFSGFISDISSQYGDQETTLVTLMSYGFDLDQYVIHNGSTTTVTYSNQDPGTIVRTEMEHFYTDEGILTGTTGSIALASTTVSYTFKLNTYLEMLQKTVELAPADWFFRLDMGEKLIYFNAKPTTADHTFVLGKDIKSLQLRSSIEDAINDVYFVGGETAPEVNLFKRYTASPVAGTRRGLKRMVDTHVITDTPAGVLSNNEITQNNKIQYRSTLSILDKQYDIESIKLGHLIAFRNFGNYVDLITLMVVGRRYTPEAVTLQLGTLPPSDRAVEQLRRSLNQEQTEYVPTIPS